jgi:hypothetical protein
VQGNQSRAMRRFSLTFVFTLEGEKLALVLVK